MTNRRFNLLGWSLRTRLRLLGESREEPLQHKRSWDLGYHHAKRGKRADTSNPHIADAESYMDGYKAAQTGAHQGSGLTGEEDHPDYNNDMSDYDVMGHVENAVDDFQDSHGRWPHSDPRVNVASMTWRHDKDDPEGVEIGDQVHANVHDVIRYAASAGGVNPSRVARTLAKTHFGGKDENGNWAPPDPKDKGERAAAFRELMQVEVQRPKRRMR